jgi:hypothetical protein
MKVYLVPVSGSVMWQGILLQVFVSFHHFITKHLRKINLKRGQAYFDSQL